MSIHLVQVQQQSLYDFNSEDINDHSLDYEYDHAMDIANLQNQQANQPFDIQMLMQPQYMPEQNIKVDIPAQDIFLQNGKRLFIDTECVLQYLDDPEQLRDLICNRQKQGNDDPISPNEWELCQLQLSLDAQQHYTQKGDTNNNMPIQFTKAHTRSNSISQPSVPSIPSTINTEINKHLTQVQRKDDSDIRVVQIQDLTRNNTDLCQLNFKTSNGASQIMQYNQPKNQNCNSVDLSSLYRDENSQHMKFAKGESKKIFQWDRLCHLKFAIVCLCFGIKNVTPKQILKVLDDPRLDREKVASHLQKFRIHVAKEYNVQVNQLQNLHIPSNLDHPFVEEIKKHWENNESIPMSNDIVKKIIKQLE